MNSITTLDNLWMGRPRTIAAALLESDGHRAVVDPGPGSTLETLHSQLQACGFGVSDLDAILLTHIHLDHAGATGALVREIPRLAVYVHKNGGPHLVDPSKLLASAERLWPTNYIAFSAKSFPFRRKICASSRAAKRSRSARAKSKLSIHQATPRTTSVTSTGRKASLSLATPRECASKEIPTSCPLLPRRTSISASGMLPSPPSWNASRRGSFSRTTVIPIILPSTF